jgi:hypothetical protein
VKDWTNRDHRKHLDSLTGSLCQAIEGGVKLKKKKEKLQMMDGRTIHRTKRTPFQTGIKE